MSRVGVRIQPALELTGQLLKHQLPGSVLGVSDLTQMCILTSSQVRMSGLIWGPHPENSCCRVVRVIFWVWPEHLNTKKLKYFKSYAKNKTRALYGGSHLSVIPVFGRLKQEDFHEFKVTLSYWVKSYLKTKKKHKHKSKQDMWSNINILCHSSLLEET